MIINIIILITVVIIIGIFPTHKQSVFGPPDDQDRSFVCEATGKQTMVFT